ncbi:hydrogen peroxide-inducible genes activator [Maritalea mediterranea]|uniref:LysR substrate-binding domain-containing protein n=1 Tax=Maritalea mediterranea TaxID=2909667 RepID=A0ABS9EBZ2_9HYPH|nr:hydrogen peroxide-inducible genes activator [Maritalea mediterranea]MCF4098943.1 LysR substrate-binding domain-containing protein [Maritalea mediterranea]
MTLKQMRYALAVQKHGHFGTAAEKSHVTQPALSQQISALETYCGKKLFERLGKRVIPTRFGEVFLLEAARIVAQVDALEEAAHEARFGLSAPIRGALIPTIAPYFLPHLLTTLAENFPTQLFNLGEMQTEMLLRQLADGELDFGIIGTKPPLDRFEAQPLFDDPFVLAAARHKNIQDPVDLNLMQNEELLLLSEGHCFRDQAIEACSLDPKGGSKDQAFAATSLATIVELVAKGFGVTLLPAMCLVREIRSDSLALHELKSPGAHRTISMVWRRTSAQKQQLRQIATLAASLATACLAMPTRSKADRAAGATPAP